MKQRYDAPGFELGSDVPVQLWAPDWLDPARPAPLIVAHDGSAYASEHMVEGDNNGPDLLGKVDDLIQSGEIEPVRVALLDPIDRHDWYTASPTYNKVLAESVLPSIEKRVTVTRPKIFVASSLGALSALSYAYQCEYQYPGRPKFDGLFLESTSFHHPDYDNYENRPFNTYYDRGQAFIEWFREAPAAAHIMEVSLTCGWEGNWDGNRALDGYLDAHGHTSELRRVHGDHNLYWWGQALTPHLGNLIKRCMYAPAEQLAS